MQTAIFDMDGLLLDTEPLWGESMLSIAAHYNIPITMEQFRFTTGLHIYEVTRFWKEKYGWQVNVSPEDVAEAIIDDIIYRAKTKGRVMPGVVTCLDWMTQNGFKLGVATSSPTKMMHDLLNHFNLSQYFNATISADTAMHGKPHPEVYLQCAHALNMSSYNCVAIEDSINGIVAAKAARMKAIAVPDLIKYDDLRFAIADMKLKSLELLNIDVWNQLFKD